MIPQKKETERENTSEYDLPFLAFLLHLTKKIPRYLAYCFGIILIIIIGSQLVHAANITIDKVYDYQGNEITNYNLYLTTNLTTNKIIYTNTTSIEYSVDTNYANTRNLTTNELMLIEKINGTYYNSLGSIVDGRYINLKLEFLYNDSTASNTSASQTYSDSAYPFNFYNPNPNKTVNKVNVWTQCSCTAACDCYTQNITMYGYNSIINNVKYNTTQKSQNLTSNGNYSFILTDKTLFNSTPYNFNNTQNDLINVTGLYTGLLVIQLLNSTSTINSFNISIQDQTTYTTNIYTTTNGIIEIPLIYNHNYTLTSTSTGYINNITNITQNTQTKFQNVTLALGNSIYITILNDATSSVIAQLIYVYFQNNASLFNYSTTNGYLNRSGLTSGDYKLSFITANNNFTTRDYYVTIGEQESPSITARLLQNTSSVPISVYVKDNSYAAVENALITVQKQYLGGSYATILQEQTDGNGFASLNVAEDTQYKIIIQASGYQLKEFYQTFYSDGSPYTWQIVSLGGTLYINIFNGINYYYTPTQGTLDNDTYNFSITTYNSTNTIAWTSVTTQSGTVNVTGSPAGSTASSTIDLSSYSGVYNVTYMFNYYDPNSGTYQTYKIPVKYYINNLETTQNNVSQVWTDFKDDVDSDVWTTILAMFLTLTLVITLIQISGGNPIMGLVGGVVGIGFFAIIGWISPAYATVSGVLIILILVLNR